MAAVSFCENEQDTQTHSRERLIERIKAKVSVKHGNVKPNLKNKLNATKTNRKVSLGWLNKDENKFIQVRGKGGGGTRSVEFEKDATMGTVKEKAITLFFPNGVSPKGGIEHFSTEIRDFSH